MHHVTSAGPTAPTLYKVVTAEGRAPFVSDYQWSMPVQGADGAWTPGAWHEESPDSLCTRGLHVTAYPRQWGGSDAGRVVCEAECEGIVGDPALDSKVLAARVRLLRVLTDVEVAAANTAWEARSQERFAAEQAKWQQEQIDRAKTRQKELLDKARKLATSRTKEIADARAQGVESPGLFCFRVMINCTPADSWVDVNGSRRQALAYVVARLRLDPADIGTIHKEFRGSYWLDAESLYVDAIQAGNASACVALEKFMGRKPWWKIGHKGKRERLHVGSQVRVGGEWHTVTSFRTDYLNAKREQGAKVYRITREMLAGNSLAGAVA